MKNRFLLHDLDPQETVTLLDNVPEGLLIFGAKPEINSCTGCFGCWVKTPGKCVISDRGVVIPQLFASSSETIVISRLVYGGFSPAIKAVWDRSIGFLMPYFRILNDEMHHVQRYPHAFKLTVHFYGENITEAEQALAHQLIAANAVNYGAESGQVFFHHSIPRIKEVI